MRRVGRGIELRVVGGFLDEKMEKMMSRFVIIFMLFCSVSSNRQQVLLADEELLLLPRYWSVRKEHTLFGGVILTGTVRFCNPGTATPFASSNSRHSSDD